MSAVVALLGGPCLLADGVRAEDPLHRLWQVLSTSQREALRQRARRWPISIRRRLLATTRPPTNPFHDFAPRFYDLRVRNR
jgi:hypothetical protein